MCHPAVYYAAVIVAAAVSAKASYDQGQHEKGVSKYNARVMENTAVEVRNRANVAETEERQKALELASRQRAIFASRGVVVDTGTALRVQEDTELIGEVNAMRVRQEGDLEVSALETQAALTRRKGKAAAQQGTSKALSTSLGTIGKLAGASIG